MTPQKNEPRSVAALQGSVSALGSARGEPVQFTATGSSAPVQALLSRLDGVRRTGRGWMARCPAHSDKHASLSIGEAPSGAALVHCHAACSTEAVLAAVGLEAGDLFPPRPDGHVSARALSAEALAERRVWSIAALLPTLVEEVTILQIAAGDIIAGRPIGAEHLQRLKLAERRIEDALTVLRPRLREVAA